MEQITIINLLPTSIIFLVSVTIIAFAYTVVRLSKINQTREEIKEFINFEFKKHAIGYFKDKYCKECEEENGCKTSSRTN